LPAAQIFDIAQQLDPGDRLALIIEGRTWRATRSADRRVQLRDAGDGRKRLQEAGLTVTALGDQVQIANVRFGSRAKKNGFEIGWQIGGVLVPTERPSMHWSTCRRCCWSRWSGGGRASENADDAGGASGLKRARADCAPLTQPWRATPRSARGRRCRR